MTEAPYRPLDVAERRERDRKVWRVAFAASILFHLLILLLGGRPPIPTSPFAAAGPSEQDDRAAEGALQVIAMTSAPPAQVIPIPTPVLDAEILEVEELLPDPEPEITPEDVELPEPPGVGTTSGSDPEDAPADAGLPGATGRGDGGTVDEGRFRLVPPTPRGMIIPPTNRNLRGRQVQVWVFVNEQGRVVADSTRLDPPTSDRRFNEQLVREAAEWVFTPARQGGEPVSSWFPYVISMD